MGGEATRIDSPARDGRADVVAWRLDQLRRYGFDEQDAAALSARTDIDLHEASRLVQRGCPPRTAARILL